VGTLDELQDRLGYHFKDLKLLRLALTHPSATHEGGGLTQHNQRLEFLGDSVLNLLLSRELFEKFPTSSEGLLTKSRARLANGQSLAKHSRAFGLGNYLTLSRGEEMCGGRDRDSALADAYEALLGAIFLDGGLEPARAFLGREFASDFSELSATEGIENPKGELQELLQACSPQPPEYQFISASGPDHERVFESAVLHEGKELARGRGKSKKAAESDAALAALEKMRAESRAAIADAPEKSV
jgi:ribonuclease-3